MMTFGFFTQIWVPLFTFPTVEAPRFPHGYPAATVFEIAMWATLCFGSWYMARWKLKNPDLEMQLAQQNRESDSLEEEAFEISQGDSKKGIAREQIVIVSGGSSKENVVVDQNHILPEDKRMRTEAKS